MILRRLTLTLLNNIETTFPQEVGKFPDMILRPYQHPAAQLLFTHSKLRQFFAETLTSISGSNHLHLGLAQQIWPSRFMILPLPTIFDGLTKKIRDTSKIATNSIHQIQHRRTRAIRLRHRADLHPIAVALLHLIE